MHRRLTGKDPRWQSAGNPGSGEKIGAESVMVGESVKPKTRTRSERDVAKREGATGGREGQQECSPQRESIS